VGPFFAGSVSWMMGNDEFYSMLFCGRPAGLFAKVTAAAGEPGCPDTPELSRFDYREVLA